jgi:hypothetical protein
MLILPPLLAKYGTLGTKPSSGPQGAGYAGPERRSGMERRLWKDRRLFDDPGYNGPERRSGIERRSGKDRRNQ